MLDHLYFFCEVESLVSEYLRELFRLNEIRTKGCICAVKGGNRLRVHYLKLLQRNMI